MKDLNWIRAYERDLIRKDNKRDFLFNRIWNMVNMNWDFDPLDKAKMPNVRTLIDSSPSDAVVNASIAMSNTIPRWEMAPYGTSIYEYQYTEKVEHCIGWHFKKMNNRGVGTLLYDKMRSSIMFDTIVTRVDDLEWLFKGVRKLSPFQKRVKALGRHVPEVFDPRTIHIEPSLGTFATLLHVENLRAWDVYNYWRLYENSETDAGRMVGAALRKMEEKFVKNQASVMNMRFIVYEYWDDDQIVRHGHFGGMGPQSTTGVTTFNSSTTSLATSPVVSPNYTVSESESGQGDIVFANEENTLGFIPFSVRVGGSRFEREPAYQVNPMLAPLHWGNSWETSNIVRSLVLSEPIKRMFEAHQFQQTADGQRLLESNDGVIVGRRGDVVQNLPPAQIDPNALQVVQAIQEQITKTTGANVLSDVTSAKTTPFATLNAMIQVAMSRLDVNRRDGALSCADDAILMMRWVDKTGVPLVSYRQKDRVANMGGQTMASLMGEQVVITADDIDADHVEIQCEIKPKTPTDFQQQILSAIQLHDKLQVPYEVLLEGLGYENVPLLRSMYQAETANNAEFQNALQVAAQQAIAQAQQAQQPPQPGQGPNGEPTAQMPNAGGGLSESAMGALNGLGQGINPAMAGSSPQQFAPGMTREAISGQTQGGGPIAAGG